MATPTGRGQMVRASRIRLQEDREGREFIKIFGEIAQMVRAHDS